MLLRSLLDATKVEASGPRVDRISWVVELEIWRLPGDGSVEGNIDPSVGSLDVVLNGSGSRLEELPTGLEVVDSGTPAFDVLSLVETEEEVEGMIDCCSMDDVGKANIGVVTGVEALVTMLLDSVTVFCDIGMSTADVSVLAATLRSILPLDVMTRPSLDDCGEPAVGIKIEVTDATVIDSEEDVASEDVVGVPSEMAVKALEGIFDVLERWEPSVCELTTYVVSIVVEGDVPGDVAA